MDVLPDNDWDWTANPLVACYFAVDEPSEDDSVIYAYQSAAYIVVRKHPDPFKYNRAGKFIPRHLTRRITTQGGLFTIHTNPYKLFEARDMEKIIIPNAIRTTLEKMLNKYGVDQFSLFPGLDSLAAHIEWLQSKQE